MSGNIKPLNDPNEIRGDKNERKTAHLEFQRGGDSNVAAKRRKHCAHGLIWGDHLSEGARMLALTVPPVEVVNGNIYVVNWGQEEPRADEKVA